MVNRPIIIGRELTKIHEEFVRALLAELLARFDAPQGEFTVLDSAEARWIRPLEASRVTRRPVVDLFGQITESGGPAQKGRAREAGERLGLTAKQVYEIIERNK